MELYMALSRLHLYCWQSSLVLYTYTLWILLLRARLSLLEGLLESLLESLLERAALERAALSMESLGPM